MDFTGICTFIYNHCNPPDLKNDRVNKPQGLTEL